MVNLTWMRQPPRKYTFDTEPIANWVRSVTQEGMVLNLFAGRNRLYEFSSNIIEHRVDLDPTVNPTFNMDAESFIQYAKKENYKYNTIILDPPYNLRKSVEKYGGRYMSNFQKIKEDILDLLLDSTNVITCGYNSVSMGENRGFSVNDILLISHGGSHNDTVITNEVRDPRKFLKIHDISYIIE